MSHETLHIYHAGEYWRMHPGGLIERPGSVNPSLTWRVTGACEFNNFGHIVRRFGLEDIVAGGIQWKGKNDKQRVFVTDLDHGTHRMWTCNHHIIGRKG